MSNDKGSISRHEAALAAIKQAYGTDQDEYGATLFVQHHLAEIDADYWLKHLRSACPQPQQVLDLLIVVSDPEEGEPDDVDSVDFTLPDQVTDAVLCVSFDEFGQVDEIAMES